MRLTIRERLTVTFIILSVSPLVLMGVVLATQSYALQERQAFELQRQVAQNMSARVEAFFNGLEGDIRLLTGIEDLRGLDTEAQRTLLTSLCAYEHSFEDVAIVDGQGIERVRYSRLRSLPSAPVSRASSDEFRLPMARGASYYGPVVYDESTAEPLMTIAVPSMDRRSGRASGVFVATIRVKRVWELIGEMPLGEGQDVYIVDSSGRLVAHRNPSFVLRRMTVALPSSHGVSMGLEGGPVIAASNTVNVGGLDFHVVAEQASSRAFALERRTVALTLLLVLAAAAASTVLGLFIVKRIAGPLREMAEVAGAMSAGDLSGRVAVRTGDELGVMADAFNRMAAQVQDLIGGLERRVAERTAQLEESNRELEAFSYSVSHDLRAPLRAVDGFARIIQEDHSAQLSPEALRLLGFIKENSLQMSRLINDLLAFSRLGRQAMKAQRVDMEDVVRQVVEGVRGETGARRVDIVVGELPPCECDPALIRQVWINLLSNAVKFTGTREEGRIEVGARADEDGRTVYYVRDNGVGFDMRYAGKLFGVFQRLHGPQEFEGTGIGLSIVQRIVRRHGGAVWAEGEVDRGATFFFTLPREMGGGKE